MRKGRILVQVPGWERYGWLRHGFSTRLGGFSTVYGGDDLNLGFTKEDAQEAVEQNRRLAVEAVGGVRDQRLVTLRQVHGTEVVVVRKKDEALMSANGRATGEADGLMTGAAGIMLGIQVADCVPVLVADVRQRVVAAFHAGWRGAASGMVQRGIAKMGEEFGSQPDDMIGAVGPSIRACCYGVGCEVREAFREFCYAEELFSVREGLQHLDLGEANRRQMVDAGLSEDAVTVLRECTGCTMVDGRRKYFSHRMEKGVTGRAMGLIGLVETTAE